MKHRESHDGTRRWHRRFDDPMPLPDGGELVTLRDAETYQPVEARERRAGMAGGCPGAVEHDGQTLLARIGMMRALYPRGPSEPTRQKRGRNIVLSGDVR